MTQQQTATRSIIVERLIPHAPEKIWRALTQAHLIEQWLMKNDFEPRLGARFTLHAQPMGDWNGLVQCEITAFDPPRRLAYSWIGGSAKNPGYGSALESDVEWTLTAEPGGTRVRMEHSGFGPENAVGYDAMSGGWVRVLERLEQIASEVQS
jgi:uncharacterized protein YndB with AHSA1/START domain